VLQHLEEGNAVPVPAAGAEEGPRLAAHVVARHERRTAVIVEEPDCGVVPPVATKPQRDPERGVDEDQGLASGP
jgi:hypothetical protein